MESTTKRSMRSHNCYVSAELSQLRFNHSLLTQKTTKQNKKHSNVQHVKLRFFIACVLFSKKEKKILFVIRQHAVRKFQFQLLVWNSTLRHPFSTEYFRCYYDDDDDEAMMMMILVFMQVILTSFKY